jgi:hypothetical protein
LEDAPAGLRITLKFYLTYMNVETFGGQPFSRGLLRLTLRLRLTKRFASAAPRLHRGVPGRPLLCKRNEANIDKSVKDLVTRFCTPGESPPSTL